MPIVDLSLNISLRRGSALVVVTAVLAGQQAEEAKADACVAPCIAAVPDLPGDIAQSIATGVSPDGETVVGYSHSGSGLEALLWTPATGSIGLGDLPGGSFQAWRTM